MVGLAIAAIAVILAGSLFILVRRLNWTIGWIYLGIVVGTLTINLPCLLRWNRELIRRRMRLGKGTKTWDKVWGVLFAPVMISVYAVAVLEGRGGESSVPGGAWLLGLVIYMLGAALLIWSMIVNPFFEKTVRIQKDHGHRVIETGPYAYVRHPGYLGFSGWILSTPLLLASTWAFITTVIAVIGVVIRTFLEDRTLLAELQGYAEYASRVRCRLMPGVW